MTLYNRRQGQRPTDRTAGRVVWEVHSTGRFRPQLRPKLCAHDGGLR